MALADTARLIASLELQDKFSRPIAGANRSLSGFERNMGGATRATRGLGVAGVAVGTAIGTLGAALLHRGFTAFVGSIAAGVESLNRLESAETATAAVIESTGGVAGISAQRVRDLAESYEDLNATIDDKVIQSGENLLLTFTNIREEAFEPALEAALNLNEALHGGEEGLQGNIILLGKALNDPIRGLARLTRVGVDFDEQQRAQIKSLVENNDLLGAQQVILDELAEEFGGQFAAAGETAAGSQAKLHDRIEDLQATLTGPLLPAIDRIRDKLIDFLGSQRVLEGAERLGGALANLLSEDNLSAGVSLIEKAIDTLSTGDFSSVTGSFGNIAETIGNLPWSSIADAARLLGTGSKALLDAFLGLPPWVQTAVLTSWGLNKLTGGAFTGILGGLAGALGKWIAQKIGLMTVQAGVVQVTGPVGGVPGTGAAGSFGRSVIRGAAVGTAIASVPLAGVATVEVINFEEMREQSREGLQAVLDQLPRSNPGEISDSLARLQAEITRERPLLEGVLFNTNIRPQLEAERQELITLGRTIDAAADKNAAATDGVKIATERVKGATDNVRNATVSLVDPIRGTTNAAMQGTAATDRVRATMGQTAAAQLARTGEVAAAVNSTTGVLKSKNFSPTVNVKTQVTSNVTISEIQRKITSSSISTGTAGNFAV